MTTITQISTNGAVENAGAAVRSMFEGRGPDIWLAGDPEDLKDLLPSGAEPVVTSFGPAIGVHTGPGAIGIALLRADTENYQ